MRWIMLYYASCGVTQIVKLALFAFYKTYAICLLKTPHIMDLLQGGGGGDFVDIFGGSPDKDCVVNS